MWAVQRRRRVRTVAVGIAFAILACVTYLLILGHGATKLSPGEVLSTLFGGGTSQQILVVWDLRFPVAIATIVSGAVLGISGSWTQTVTRNPWRAPMSSAYPGEQQWVLLPPYHWATQAGPPPQRGFLWERL